MEKDPHNLRKYEELYRLTKEGLQEERARSIRLDEKAERYLTQSARILVKGAK